MFRPLSTAKAAAAMTTAAAMRGPKNPFLTPEALSRFIPNPMSCEIIGDSRSSVQEEFSRLAPSLFQSVHRWQELIYSRFPPNARNRDFTVYTGTAGIAYMYLYLYLTSSSAFGSASPVTHSAATAATSTGGDTTLPDPETLTRLYLQRGLEYARASEAAVTSRRHSRGTPPTERDITFLTGDAGPFAIGAVLHDIAGERDTATVLLDQLLLLHEPCLDENFTSNELLYGRAGYLYAALFVNKYFGRDIISADIINRIAQIILSQGRSGSKSEQPPFMWHFHGKAYLGGAHGVAGIINLLLHIDSLASDSTFLDEAQQTASYLIANSQWETGNFMSSLNKSPSDDYLVQWCHGAPGIVPMLLKLRQAVQFQAQTQIRQQQRQQQATLEAVVKGLDCIWERGLLRKGLGLCHGIVGNMYPFLYAFEHTLLVPEDADVLEGDKQLRRALQFARFSIDREMERELLMAPDHPFSLFEGLAGAVVGLQNLAVERNVPRFPTFEFVVERGRRVIQLHTSDPHSIA